MTASQPRQDGRLSPAPLPVPGVGAKHGAALALPEVTVSEARWEQPGVEADKALQEGRGSEPGTQIPDSEREGRAKARQGAAGTSHPC